MIPLNSRGISSQKRDEHRYDVGNLLPSWFRNEVTLCIKQKKKCSIHKTIIKSLLKNFHFHRYFPSSISLFPLCISFLSASLFTIFLSFKSSLNEISNESILIRTNTDFERIEILEISSQDRYNSSTFPLSLIAFGSITSSLSLSLYLSIILSLSIYPSFSLSLWLRGKEPQIHFLEDTSSLCISSRIFLEPSSTIMMWMHLPLSSSLLPLSSSLSLSLSLPLSLSF